MKVVARGSRVCAGWLALAALSGCGHVPHGPPREAVPIEEDAAEKPDVSSDMVLRVHHHWADCREGISGEAQVSLGERSARLAPGEALALPLSPGPHAVHLRWDGPDGPRARTEAIEVDGLSRVRELHLGCSPQALASRPLVPLVLLPDGPSGYAGLIRLGGVTVEVPREGRRAVYLPRGGHRLGLASPVPGCPDASTTISLDGAGRVVHLGPCGEARAVPLLTRPTVRPFPDPTRPEGALGAGTERSDGVAPEPADDSGDCAFEGASVGSAP
jgi:hypothetical protein